MTVWNRLTSIASLAALLGGAISGVVVSVAADSQSVPTAVTVEAAPDPMQEVTPERQAAAETFASLHHPELAKLLSRLKTGRQADYDNAVRELFRESERLAKLKGRDPERHALELEVWKVSSRIQLATARLAMEDSPELRTELRDLLQTKLGLRTKLLRLERDKAATRFAKLESELLELQADPATAAELELEKLLKSARARANQAAKQNQGSRSKPAAKAKLTESSGAADSKAAAPQSPRGASASPPPASKN